MEILCFFAGIVFVYTHSLYPLLFIALALFLKANPLIIIWFSAAIFWGWCHQWWVSDRGLPTVAIIQKATLQGTIHSIPITTPIKTQFQFTVTHLNGQPAHTNVLLSCYTHCPVFRTGETWQLQAKLKKPTNLGNPGHIDYLSNLHARHIHWTGYLRQEKKPILIAPSTSFNILMVREHLAHLLTKTTLNMHALAIVQALTLGISNHITKSQWDLFRRTGTTHLMVISGSHIALIAGIIYWLLQWLWSRSSRLCLAYPAIQIASIGGLLIAFLYTLLAGFEVPAQRALVTCILLLLQPFRNSPLTSWQYWRYALFVVLIFEPHVVLLPGFYLSFVAVAILLIFHQRIPYHGIKKAIGLQLACLIGMMPFTLYWFSYGSVNGLLANLICIPLIGYVIVPLALCHLCLTSLFAISSPLSIALNLLIKHLLHYLNWLDQFSLINFNFIVSTLSLFALIVSLFIIFFLPLRPFILPTSILIVCSLFPTYPRVRPGEAQIDVLDVGQGLAIVVRTTHHTLIYDTGMKFYQGSDMAQLAIIPYLATLSIHHLDTVIISHPDRDHRGGLPSLEKKYPINELLVNDVNVYHRGKNCHHSPSWKWDGISFAFSPIKQVFTNRNNTSCVLRISSATTNMLLTGDIEKPAENYLIHTYGPQLKADYLLIAHHGSKTSSSAAFIKQVSPHYAVISSGLDNHYHFPHVSTLTTLAAQHIPLFNTAQCGMVTVKLTDHHPLQPPTCYHSEGEMQVKPAGTRYRHTSRHFQNPL